MKDINLIRKIAWSFHATTKIDFEELFCEASLAYCEALKKYQPNKGKLSSWLWIYIQQRLIDFYKKEQKNKFMVSFDDDFIEDVASNNFEDFYKTLPNTCQEIADLILDSDIDIIIEKNSRTRRGFVSRLLRENNWKWHDIYYGINKFKEIFN